MTIRHSLAACIAFSMIATLTTACGSEPASTVEPTVIEDVDTAGTEAATVELPENFPPGFPLPPDLELTDARFTAGDPMTQANHLVQGTSRMGVPELDSFYRERLVEAGYAVQPSPPTQSATSAMIMFSSEEFTNCSVQLRQVDDHTNVLISLPVAD